MGSLFSRGRAKHLNSYRVVVASSAASDEGVGNSRRKAAGGAAACPRWIANPDQRDAEPVGGAGGGSRSGSAAAPTRRRKAGGSPRKRGKGGGGAAGAGARKSSRPALRRTKTVGASLGGAGGTSELSRDDFNWKCMLGKGAIGRVRLAQLRSSGRFYAVKCISKALVNDKQNVEHIRTELDILRRLRHPFIARMFAAFQDDGVLALCLEYACGARHLFLFFSGTMSDFLPVCACA